MDLPREFDLKISSIVLYTFSRKTFMKLKLNPEQLGIEKLAYNFTASK